MKTASAFARTAYSAIQWLSPLVVLLVLTFQDRGTQPAFFQLESIILLLQIFVGCLYASPYASGLSALQAVGVVLSLY